MVGTDAARAADRSAARPPGRFRRDGASDVGLAADRLAGVRVPDLRVLRDRVGCSGRARSAGAALPGLQRRADVAARDHAHEEAVESALSFARRRRLGPFAPSPQDPRAAEKALAAMVRAGHDFRLAKYLLSLPPGVEIDRDDLRDFS